MPAQAAALAQPDTRGQRAFPGDSHLALLLGRALLAGSAALFALHFLHLSADFPNGSPWVDWSKYTDEGWYGDAAIRHYLTGHWYWKGDFNPAVALPVWPAMELVWFKMTGVSAAAARSLTLLVFAGTLLGFYRLIARCERLFGDGGRSLAAPLAVFLLCASPLFYVFERMAILEPLLIALTVAALLAATHLGPLLGGWRGESHGRSGWLGLYRPLGWSVGLGILLTAMVLTKTTGVALFPAVGYMIWAREGFRTRTALRRAALPALVAAALWLGYYLLFVRPHFLEDYRYLFSANAYTGLLLEPFPRVVWNTLADGLYIGYVLYPLFFVCLLLLLLWKPGLFRNPLLPALLLWTAGYFAFLAYHYNLQPRYYLVVAAPITVMVAMALNWLVRAEWRTPRRWLVAGTCGAAALAVAVPDLAKQLSFMRHPTYQFQAAAHGIQRIVLGDSTHSHLLLSISGSDLTLMTGLPTIDDDFGTMDLGERVARYRPGWYAAWNELDDDVMDALGPLYHPVRVAEFPAMDDPDRNLLILYRLDPVGEEGPSASRKRRQRTPRALRTRLGQQPSTTQLVH